MIPHPGSKYAIHRKLLRTVAQPFNHDPWQVCCRTLIQHVADAAVCPACLEVAVMYNLPNPLLSQMSRLFWLSRELLLISQQLALLSCGQSEPAAFAFTSTIRLLVDYQADPIFNIAFKMQLPEELSAMHLDQHLQCPSRQAASNAFNC